MLDLVGSGLLVPDECIACSGDMCGVGCGIVFSNISARSKVENVRFASSAGLNRVRWYGSGSSYSSRMW